MNIRKPSDYSSLYSALNVLMGSDLAETELYCEIGRAVCARTEKGAAVMAAEYLQAEYPDRKGFSPRNLRRMRSFYLAYGNTPALLEKALKLAWTQNVTLLEACETAEERVWYLNAALAYGCGKAELLQQIQNGVWRIHGLDEPEDICYTEEKQETVEYGQSEKDTFYLSREYTSKPQKWLILLDFRRLLPQMYYLFTTFKRSGQHELPRHDRSNRGQGMIDVPCPLCSVVGVTVVGLSVVGKTDVGKSNAIKYRYK